LFLPRKIHWTRFIFFDVFKSFLKLWFITWIFPKILPKQMVFLMISIEIDLQWEIHPLVLSKLILIFYTSKQTSIENSSRTICFHLTFIKNTICFGKIFGKIHVINHSFKKLLKTSKNMKRVQCIFLGKSKSIVEFQTQYFKFVCLMVLNATFNNISVISWRTLLY
jgi:hypothetical protein